MNFEKYLKVANARMLGCALSREFSVAALRLTNFDIFELGCINTKYLGEVPFITSKSDKEEKDLAQLNDYEITYSTVFNDTLKYVLKQIESDTNDSFEFNVDTMHEHDPEIIISELSIVYQYSLLEQYEISQYEQLLVNGAIHKIDDSRYTLSDINARGYEKLLKGAIADKVRQYSFYSVKKRIENWNKIDVCYSDLQNLIERYTCLSDRRNEIIHSSEHKKTNIREALDFFASCRSIAHSIGNAFKDDSAVNYKTSIL